MFASAAKGIAAPAPRGEVADDHHPLVVPAIHERAGDGAQEEVRQRRRQEDQAGRQRRVGDGQTRTPSATWWSRSPKRLIVWASQKAAKRASSARRRYGWPRAVGRSAGAGSRDGPRTAAQHDRLRSMLGVRQLHVPRQTDARARRSSPRTAWRTRTSPGHGDEHVADADDVAEGWERERDDVAAIGPARRKNCRPNSVAAGRGRQRSGRRDEAGGASDGT